MPCSKNHNDFYQTIGRMISLICAFLSVLVIVSSLFCRKKYISQDRLRCSYDGLSPNDYQ